MIATELREKQDLELNSKKIELENKTLKANLQQKANELDDIKGHLLAEKQESSLRATSLTQQQQLYETLKSESSLTTEQYNKLYKELESTGNTRKSLEDKVRALWGQLRMNTYTCTQGYMYISILLHFIVF